MEKRVTLGFSLSLEFPHFPKKKKSALRAFWMLWWRYNTLSDPTGEWRAATARRDRGRALPHPAPMVAGTQRLRAEVSQRYRLRGPAAFPEAGGPAARMSHMPGWCYARTRTPATWTRARCPRFWPHRDRKSTRLNSSHLGISYAVFCLK